MEDENFKLLNENPNEALKQIMELHGVQLKKKIELTITDDEELVKDVINETLLCLYVKREEVVKLEKPFFWMMTVASNIAFSQFRGEHRSLKVSIEDIISDPSDSVQADTELCYKELHRLFIQAVEQLTPKERDVVIDATLHDMDNDQLGEKHGVTKQRAKNILSTGLKKLRRILDGAQK